MNQKIRLDNVKKNKRVFLVKELPVNRSFGNKNPVPNGKWGDITSEGFVDGVLKVKFWTHLSGTENTRFNELSAREYMLVEV
jgi:hypothetical protein